MNENRGASSLMTLALLIEISSRAQKDIEQAVEKMQTRVKEHQNVETFMLTQEHIDFLRQAPVVWDPSEAGAPIIDPESLFRSGLHGVATAFATILRFGKIQAGTYTITNRVRDRYPQCLIRADIEGNMIDIPQDQPIEFNLTEQHIGLLRRANVDALMYFGACGLNSKHPYGDKTYWEIDMAHAIGMPVYRDQNGAPCFTEEELDMLHGLHQDMLIAMPVLLAHAQIEPGQFIRKPGANWEVAAS